MPTTARVTAKNTLSAVARRDDDIARFVYLDPRRAGRAELGDLLGEDAASRCSYDEYQTISSFGWVDFE